jgi:hypothetical protein
VNFDNLVNTRKNKRVRGFPSLKKPYMGMCKNDEIGMMGKTSFKRNNCYSEEVLELVHTDLCEPVGIEIYYGDKCIILFVNDYSRMMVVM